MTPTKMFKQNKKVVFLDRDGVICKHIPHLHKKENLSLLPKVAQAIKLLKDNNYLVILITNQSIVARDLCTERELKRIHHFLQSKLKEESGYKLDKIYYCPHHPNGSNKKYSINCNCRKPNPGLILKAKKRFKLKGGFMIGDSETDIIAGKRAHCKTILITDKDRKNGIKEKPDYIAKTLLDAVKIIIRTKA